MKVKLGFLIAAASVMAFGVGATAFAQGANSTGRSQLRSNTKSENRRAVIQSEAPAAAEGSSTAVLTQTAPPPVKRFTLTLMNQMQFNKQALNNSEMMPSGLNRFQVSYNLSDTKLLTFRADSPFSQTAKNQPTEYHINDPYIAYTDTKFATLPGNWVVSIQPRVYLPLGETTRFVTKAAGSEALLILADKPYGKFNFEIIGFGQYVNNTQDYSFAYDAKQGRYVSRGNRDWSAFVEGEVAYSLTEKVTLIHDAYLWTDAFRGGPDEPARRRNTLINETIVSYAPIKQVKIMASVENDAPIEPEKDLALYQDSNVIYNLYLRLTL